MRFDQYQAKLRELGTEAGEMRRAAGSSTGESRKSFNARYTRLLTKIGHTVSDIRVEHKSRCWDDNDPAYKALAAQWALARAKEITNEN